MSGKLLCVGVVALATALAVHPVRATTAAGYCAPNYYAAPEYYQIDLVSTKRVPGTAYSRGIGGVTFASSPFSINLSTDGSYRHLVSLNFERLPDPPEGVYAVWFATTELDQVESIGALGSDRQIDGTVEWNRFMVVVSLEPSASEIGDRWSGPIVMRGLSRSGNMHTMAGHGPFQIENCATYGF